MQRRFSLILFPSIFIGYFVYISHGFIPHGSLRRNGGLFHRTVLSLAKRSTRQIKSDDTPRPQKSKDFQTWRIFGVEVHPDDLQLDLQHERSMKLPIDQMFLHPALFEALWKRLKIECKNSNTYPDSVKAVRVVRRSLDARSKRRVDGSVGPRFVYVVDVDLKSVGTIRLKQQPGRNELLSDKVYLKTSDPLNRTVAPTDKRKSVIIVGAGPAGLFCALTLARQGVHVILMERGQPVESRGKDIGALIHRRSLDSESNFAFGEGGAGTWSDGKLTTRIGRNSEEVRYVLETFVKYGAPESILLDGAPHLGTDNLVRLLRNMRLDLRQLGSEVYFGTKMTNLIIENGFVIGVEYEARPAPERNTGFRVENGLEVNEAGIMQADAVVLATGHSARDVYEILHKSGVQLEEKGFAVGFRVEHPQKLINKIQYGSEWGPSVVTEKETTDRINQEYFSGITSVEKHAGQLPVPSYRLATDLASDGTENRGVYSFCMCPGGQIVLASTESDQICVNGMSFSRRDSLWANSALVVTVRRDDPILEPYREEHGVLAGIAFQRDMERRASLMGGGNFTVPVQRITDFLRGTASKSAPPSSYRLGVKPAGCHEIYPAPLTNSIRCALLDYFDRQMPGYICEEGLLHAVETRTSSPVRILRDEITLKAAGLENCFPAGEGAGFAGGIVSAAVDGLAVARALLGSFSGDDSRPIVGTRVDSFY